MKTKLFVAAMALALVSCGSNKQESQNTSEEAEAQEVQEQTISLEGNWRLADYPGEAEMVEPSADENYVLTILPDGTFNMTTDCNALGGQYVVNGDSIKFDNIASTLMACPNEQIEKDMKTILPMVDTYAITPDSVLILRSDMRIMARFTAQK